MRRDKNLFFLFFFILNIILTFGKKKSHNQTATIYSPFCNLIKSAFNEFCTLLISFHFTRASVIQIYLRDWASKLTSATILSVDYRLRDKFPGALQDVLDAYLAVAGFSFQRQSETVTNQSQRILGFRPKRILLLGDSCGGNLIMGLLCLLNEIRRLHPAHRLLMPFAVCPIYPVFDLRAVCSASRLLGAFDPILHNGNLLSMHGCYGGMQAGACRILLIVFEICPFSFRNVRPVLEVGKRTSIRAANSIFGRQIVVKSLRLFAFSFSGLRFVDLLQVCQRTGTFNGRSIEVNNKLLI